MRGLLLGSAALGVLCCAFAVATAEMPGQESPEQAPVAPQAADVSATPDIGARGALGRAEQALDSKHLLEALRFYEIAVEKSKPGSRTRAAALFGAGMLRLHPHPGLRDIEKGRKVLQEFEASSADTTTSSLGALVALALADDATQTQADEQRLREALSKGEESWRTEREELKKQAADARSEADQCHEDLKTQAAKIDRLEQEKADQLKQIEQLRVDLQSRDDAIKAKQAALNKMKKALTKQRPAIKSETRP